MSGVVRGPGKLNCPCLKWSIYFHSGSHSCLSSLSLSPNADHTMTSDLSTGHPSPSRTFAHQSQLPKLPIPPLEETCKRYLIALKGLQDSKEHEITKRAVDQFLHDDGPRMQAKLQSWAKNKARCGSFLEIRIRNFKLVALLSYIEDFWYVSVLLALLSRT